MPFTAIPFLENAGLKWDQEELNPDPQVDAQIKFFAKEGYLVLPKAIPETDVDSLVATLKAQHEGKTYEQWRRVQDAWREITLVKQIACDRKILTLLEILYQRKPIPFQTLNFSLGSEQKIHSDCIHFSAKPERYMCGVWVALEDIDENNGPLIYYPESHTLPIVTMEDLGIDGSKTPLNYEAYRLYENYIEDMLVGLKLKPLSLDIKKGDALIWSANLLHGGAPIRDKTKTRFSQVTHYYFDNCLYYTPLFSNTFQGKLFYRQIVDIETGTPVANKYLNQNSGNFITNSNLPRRGLHLLRNWLKLERDSGY
ncbi:MAG: phytanoyl-CoA dioxygenase family protein [Methylococcaceae bacterium]|nr:phytanoyl-CoA dioxygenase family protein [Methylococcaceae bacterium]